MPTPHCAVDLQRTTPYQPVERHSYGMPTYRTISDMLDGYVGEDPIHVLYPRKIKMAARPFIEEFCGDTLYAVKANPHPTVLKILWGEGVRCFDVASLRELEEVHALLPGANLYLMHPVKSRGLIARAYAMGVRDFAFDCAAELEKVIECTNSATDLNLHLRLSLPTSDAIMPLDGKFGASLDSGAALLTEARFVAARLGLCFHVGSQCLNPAAYDKAIALCRIVADTAGVAIDSLDIGGGFPVRYPGMRVPPLAEYFSSIATSVKTHGFENIDILGEPGRALCAEGGSTLARIELRKGKDLYLNDGTYGSLFDAGKFGWKFPVSLHRASPPSWPNDTIGFRFFGPTCDSIDEMDGPFYLPADANEGDWVEIAHLGAYGQALSTRFNGFYSTTTVAILGASLSAVPLEDYS